MKVVKDVDAYIASAPKDTQGRLNDLRKAIQEVVPNAEEKISYGIPSYHYKGRLVYFSIAKEHIGIYAIFEPVRVQFKDELKGYVMSKGTIRLPLKEKLPIVLVKKLVKAQAKLNEKAEKSAKGRSSSGRKK